MYFGGGASTSTTTDDIHSKFHRSRDIRSRPPPPTGRTPIYDYDEWSKNHYGSTFQRQMQFKQRQRMQRLRREEELNDIKLEKLFLVFGVILVVCMYLFHDRTDYDQVSYFSLKPPKPTPKD